MDHKTEALNDPMESTLLLSAQQTAAMSNNTIIALLNGGAVTTSYMAHDGTVGAGTANYNYFDPYGAYYPNTMTSAQGWTSITGNIDMDTGATITP